MKKLILLTICALAINLYAQDNTSTLTVSGQSKLMVTPDITVINIELNSTDLDYSKSIDELQIKSSNLKSFLKERGITSDYIKSENFQIDKSYSYESGKQKYNGYNAKLWIRLEFHNNNDLANKIINAIGSSNVDADVAIKFELSLTKQDSINNKLIEFAIEDANTKAKIIAASTDQEIVKIERINYGVRENVMFDGDLAYSNIRASETTAAAGIQNKSFSITPKDIGKTTKIIIYYQLKSK